MLPHLGCAISTGWVRRGLGRLKQEPQHPSARARSFVTLEGWHSLTASTHRLIDLLSPILCIKTKSILSPHVWAVPRIKGSSSVYSTPVQQNKPTTTFNTTSRRWSSLWKYATSQVFPQSANGREQRQDLSWKAETWPGLLVRLCWWEGEVQRGDTALHLK